jgi:hypothetical protein
MGGELLWMDCNSSSNTSRNTAAAGVQCVPSMAHTAGITPAGAASQVQHAEQEHSGCRRTASAVLQGMACTHL